MADGADLTFDSASFDRAGAAIVRANLTAGANAVRTTTRWLEQQIEDALRQAVPGRLWRAVASRSYPKSGPARDPAGEVYLNGKDRTRGAIAFWTQPGEVRGRSGQYLAIPLPAAGSRGRGRDLTPGEWERTTGRRLQFIYRQGKPSLLVAVGGTTNARSGGFRPLTAGRQRAGRAGSNPQADAIVPIFVLLPMVKFRNAVALQPIVASAEARLGGEFLAELGARGT